MLCEMKNQFETKYLSLEEVKQFMINEYNVNFEIFGYEDALESVFTQLDT